MQYNKSILLYYLTRVDSCFLFNIYYKFNKYKYKYKYKMVFIYFIDLIQ